MAIYITENFKNYPSEASSAISVWQVVSGALDNQSSCCAADLDRSQADEELQPSWPPWHEVADDLNYHAEAQDPRLSMFEQAFTFWQKQEASDDAAAAQSEDSELEEAMWDQSLADDWNDRVTASGFSCAGQSIAGSSGDREQNVASSAEPEWDPERVLRLELKKLGLQGDDVEKIVRESLYGGIEDVW